MEKVLAPIILFVYNRPKHTKKTLEALEKSIDASDSDIYIYSDGAKNADGIDSVNRVRAIIREPWNFKSIHIIERSKNVGLANNIIKGVTEVIEKHGKAIVLEDDLEVSKFALQYFNDALVCYEEDEQVMEISGYMYPVAHADNLPEAFFFRVANSWGWATWARAWKHFNADIDELTNNFSKEHIKRFSIDHTENFWKQVKLYKSGKINSWAIRWYLSIFNKNGLVLYPRTSMIQNMGTDGSGTHSDVDEIYKVTLATQKVNNFPKEIEEHNAAYEAIKYFYKNRKGSFVKRVARYIRKHWDKRKK
ncbi:Glycosyl transferase family 2 [Sphingobacterium nematocida]|uniref:Glycosyl transferase family 2 n=1 Tax=Sphingobacterium nematocida TaxID=1513896 RepID=A0A1T5D6B0_9SPHI|nr:glycosyltransferase [Sphingobacterium nematocida]SKB67063.1 Glycosyl transferase family 2 [Sphingobacterium nematocida]